MDDPSRAAAVPASSAASSDAGTIELTLAPDELELVRAALGYLRQTLGREEADELDAVQRLLRRLPPTR